MHPACIVVSGLFLGQEQSFFKEKINLFYCFSKEKIKTFEVGRGHVEKTFKHTLLSSETAGSAGNG